MLPEDLKTRALRRARQRGISLGELLRESLEAALADSANGTPAADPLFGDLAIYYGSVPLDLAESHDRYLYGESQDE
jgi:hypothetical protein